MAEIKQQYVFTFREVAEALIKQQDLHEGIWGIYVEFGINGTNVHDPNTGQMFPTAMVPILRLGLQRFEKQNALAVDAAEVNPSQKRK